MNIHFLRLIGPVAFLASLVIAPLPALAVDKPMPGQLLKATCPANAAVNDPCKAVYYYGADGKRHSFPNEKVFLSWYGDFSTVWSVSQTVLSAIPLGPNVTYRPGVKLVKFTTVDKVYAVSSGGGLRWITSETVAQALYGPTWNKQVDDISDAFFTDYHQAAVINSTADYDKTAEQQTAASINDDLASTSRSFTINTDRGDFAIDLIRLHQDRFKMITDAANAADCDDNCPTMTLADFAQEAKASIGINGTYFCPPEYASCVGKTNTFLAPVYDSASGVMLNADSLQVHEGPLLAATTDGAYRYFHRTKEFGRSVFDFESRTHLVLQAALANYPSLIEGGKRVVGSEARLAETQPTVKSIRGGIGMDARFIYLVIAHQATVEDLASIMQALGATDALNLDGGGSSALLYDGSYAFGPGRKIPNAILFKAL